MLNILYLVHRLPYPPNKGDKVRSFNILKHLSIANNVYLGTFIDDPEDEKYVARVKTLCKYAYIQKINKKYSKLRSLLGLFKKSPLSLEYYNSSIFHKFINDIIRNNKIDAVVVFSSVMAQFVDKNLHPQMLVDFVDVDSYKWNEYANKVSYPFSWLYKRESTYLLRYERSLALQAKHSFFVTELERKLFSGLAPESHFKTSSLNNGVDSDYFSSLIDFPFPFEQSSQELIPIVFTGAMDYLPNIDAVIWFVNNVFVELAKIYSNIRFYIVGRNPSQLVLNLVSNQVLVTGTVEDVRPYLQHAAVVVAPLRIARGIQNKILEAMSMGRPVVASTVCVQGIKSNEGQDIISAETPTEFIEKIVFLIQNKEKAELIGISARATIKAEYSWSSHLKGMDKYLNLHAAETVA